MGEVYRARDPRLGREVAIKVLPASFSSDADRLRRFEQEARAASALNHPNILTVHDFGTHDGLPYVVSELLEGETLRSELAAGKLSQRRAIDYSVQIAHGLAAAHEKGIVHRDLKPENLFVTRDGRVKILDFGLAKLIQRNGPTGEETSAPTATPGTEPGIVLGTVGYMSPEQVRGKPADARSDIFSFGAILYEMLTGRRAFQGDSAADTMSAILKEDPPDLSVISQNVSPGLEQIVRHCLEKNPEQRFHSARDVAFTLGTLSGVSGVPALTSPVPNVSRWRAGTLALLLVAAALAATAIIRRSTGDRASGVSRLSVLAPEEISGFGRLGTPILSPDGRSIAFIALDARSLPSLWIRSLADPKSRRLEAPGISGYPCWSPDSRSLAYLAPSAEGSAVKKISAAGGPAITVASIASERSGIVSWSRAGDLLLGVEGRFAVVDQAGGAPRPFVPGDGVPAGAVRAFPEFLPDGRHFLYQVRASSTAKFSIYVASLDDRKTKLLLSDADSQGTYAAPGYLLFVRDRTLFAQPFDVKSLRLSGEPTAVAGDVAFFRGRRALFSVAGPLAFAYVPEERMATQLAWFDRQGNRLESVPAPDSSQSPEISPDGGRVVVERRMDESGARDLWMVDLLRGSAARFSFGQGDESDAVWSPDGTRVAFRSNQGEKGAVFVKSAESAGREERLTALPEEDLIPDSWSRDGRFLLVESPLNGKSALRVFPVEGAGQPIPLPTAGNARDGQFSPDGRWIAYQSDESGRFEVYVRGFPSGGQWQISTEGGFRPRWRPDGRELFYISPERKLMTVTVESGEPFRASPPRSLFQTKLAGPLEVGIRSNYAVAPPDGKRFLIVTETGQASPPSFTVVLNWQSELKK
jgi:serine/threonine protein kinase